MWELCGKSHLRVFDAGVNEAVGGVDDQVQNEEQTGVKNDEADDEWVIAIERAVHKRDADAGDLENVFDDERSGKEIGEERAGVGENGEDGDSESVFPKGGLFAEAFGARGHDEFGLEGVEHAFAHEAGDAAGEVEAEGDGWENGVPWRGP